MLRKLSIAAAAIALMAGTASAQFLHIGDPDVQLADLTSGGKPNTLSISDISGTADYAFGGAPLNVSFNLDGSGATVWLIVYTADRPAPFTIKGEGPGPYADPEHAGAGWHVFDGVNTLVIKSAGERFGEGANTINWNGRDMDGNPVPRGGYNLFLAAFDDEATPHVVGNFTRAFGSGVTMMMNTQRGEFVNFGAGEVNNMENDWIENLQGFDLVDNQSVVDACAEREGCNATVHSWTPLNAEQTEFIGNQYSGGHFLKRFSYNWDTRQVLMNEDWGADNGAENGILATGDVLPGRAYQSVTDPAKGEVYVSAGVSGTVSKVATWRVGDGAFVPAKDWDLTDIFLYDNNGSDRSGGPGTLARMFNGESDPAGITMSGHHTSLTTRMDYDGNIKYMNRNGDNFGDSRIFADGTFGDFAYGHTEAPAFKYAIYATKYGWVSNVEAGSDNTRNGFVLGEDGSGLFSFEPKRIPITWPQLSMIVDEDGPWDGMYMQVGGFGDASLANDFVPKAEDGAAGPILGMFPVVQLPYDQKRVPLGNAPTAILEQSAEVPDGYSLSEAYPNPFNPETTIRFQLPSAEQFKITVYNEQGQAIRTLADQQLGPGTFDITWDGTDDSGRSVASGTYLYLIEGPNLRTHKKVTLLK
ncbi:MAG: T9SS type A sorting domain-containing protein [Gemmatimonadetes bacterium]|nr:T9SS type A sorting domain-containing protein [Gemmatimonadota bacterium]